ILRPEMPRSLIYCARFIESQVETLAQFYGKMQVCDDAAQQLRAMVEGTTMDTIFAHGLHEFLTEFMARNDRVSDSLSESYNFY
ncbi:MAG: alpha-E domain-containing protein, partial [Ferrovibrio sp.]